MLTDISSEMVHSLLPMYLLTTMGVSVLSIGVIEGIAESTALILKVFSGAYTDYLGRRKAMVVTGYALSALTKPVFPLATSMSAVLIAKFIDRIGKGIRDAPRDALIADVTPEGLRGAAFGLRQTIDTVGAFLGPLIAMALMLLWANDFQKVFWMACLPALAAVVVMFSITEPVKTSETEVAHSLQWATLKQLSRRYWFYVLMGGMLGLARFSAAFLILRAFDIAIPLGLVPLVLVAMNLVYAASAYPFGVLSDRFSHTSQLLMGMLILTAADVCLSAGKHWLYVLGGVSLWGLHLGMTQSLMAGIVASVAPEDLRGTAFGFYNLALGLAILFSSILAGFLWQSFGAETAFYTSAMFCVVAIAMLCFDKFISRNKN